MCHILGKKPTVRRTKLLVLQRAGSRGRDKHIQSLNSTCINFKFKAGQRGVCLYSQNLGERGKAIKYWKPAQGHGKLSRQWAKEGRQKSLLYSVLLKPSVKVDSEGEIQELDFHSKTCSLGWEGVGRENNIFKRLNSWRATFLFYINLIIRWQTDKKGMRLKLEKKIV